MQTTTHFGYLALGFILLIKGSDLFVDAASRIAKKFGVSEFIIGLTLVAIGTSVPELASSISASLQGYSGIITGNIVGSNIANIGLILGISVSYKAIKTNKNVLRRDGYMMLFAVFIFYLFIRDGVISKIEGIILLVSYVTYLLFLFNYGKKKDNYNFHEFARYFFRFEYLFTIKDDVIKKAIKSRNNHKKKYEVSRIKKIYTSFKEGLMKDAIIVILGIIAIVYGANHLVTESVWFADLLRVPREFVGISVIAVGTSLPELSVSITAARKGFGNMTAGNVIGSNITNILLVIGVAPIINSVEVARSVIIFSTPFMLLISTILLAFMSSKDMISRKEGAALLIFYFAFMTTLFLSGPGGI